MGRNQEWVLKFIAVVPSWFARQSTHRALLISGLQQERLKWGGQHDSATLRRALEDIQNHVLMTYGTQTQYRIMTYLKRQLHGNLWVSFHLLHKHTLMWCMTSSRACHPHRYHLHKWFLCKLHSSKLMLPLSWHYLHKHHLWSIWLHHPMRWKSHLWLLGRRDFLNRWIWRS